MALLNQYAGATRSVLGASYLDSKAILNIQEGYKIGDTTEYIDLGNFEVEDFTNNGAMNQTLTINAHNSIKRLDYNNTFLSRSFTNHKIFYDDFDDVNTLGQNYSQSGSDTWGITAGGLLISVTGENYCVLNQLQCSDTRIIIKALTGITLCDLGILFRAQNIDVGSYSGYMLQIYSNTFNLYKGVRGAWTLLSGASCGYRPANTFYWYMIVARGNNIKGYISTNGKAYIKYIDSNDNTYTNGSIGLRASVAGTQSYDFLDIVEIGNQYTTEDILKHTLAMGGVFDTWIQPELEGVSGWLASTGSCFVVGNTNGYQQVDLYHTTTGSSWHTFTNNGATWNNYVLTGEFLGTSGTYAGAITGSTNKFYGLYHYISSSYTAAASNVIENYINARFPYDQVGEYFRPIENTWYKFKLIKNNLFLGWYVNDLLIGSIYGTSLPNTGGTNNNIGLFSFQTGVSGMRTSWRNIRISKLDDLVDDVLIEPNTPLSSTLTRYLPEGYAINQHGVTVEIFEVGASRGTIGVSNYIINSNERISNVIGDKFVVAKGNDIIAQTVNSNTRVINQLDSTRTTFIQDQNLQNRTDAKNLTDTKIEIGNKDIQPYDCQIRPRVESERYDTVNVVDSVLGISSVKLVQNSEKSYNSSDGSFIQNLQLIDKT